MIRQDLLKKLSEENIQKVLKKKGDKKVYINSTNGLWRPGAKGYTDDRKQAWVLSLSQAWEETKHCGPEKRVSYPYYVETEPIVAADLACEEKLINANDTTIKTAVYGD